MVERIDCRGKRCPMPIILLRQAMGRRAVGVEIQIEVDNETAAQNVQQYLKDYGVLVEFTETSGIYSTQFANPKLEETTAVLPSTTKSTQEVGKVEKTKRGPVVLIASRHLGSGDDTLGDVLMKGFLSTLLEWEELPSTIALMNGGVFLCSHSSGTVDTLLELATRGVEIIACGACVDYYGLKERIAVGEIGNMYTISERLSKAERVIRI